MKTMTPTLLALAIGSLITAPAHAFDHTLTTTQLTGIARDAFVYGLPIYENYKVFHSALAGKGLLTNRFYHNSKPANADDKDVVSPNNDTPYSSAFLDLRAEPMVLSYEDFPDHRFFMFQFVDAHTNNVDYISANSHPPSAGNGWARQEILIVGKSQQGKVPESLKNAYAKVIEIDGDFVFLLGRTELKNFNSGELAAIQKGFQLTPLSAHPFAQGVWTEEDVNRDIATGAGDIAPILAKSNIKTAPYSMDVNDLNIINHMLTMFQAPYAMETGLMQQFAKIDVGPGKTLKVDELSAEEIAALQEGMIRAISDSLAYLTSTRPPENGWIMPQYDIPYFCRATTAPCAETDYLSRSGYALMGLYVNSPTEAVYPVAQKDADNQMLNSANRYMITFEDGQLPDANFFSSITVYDSAQKLFIDNPENRYSVGKYSPLIIDADGKLRIYLQSTAPFDEGDPRNANWLPLHQDKSADFYVMTRAYGPTWDANYRLPEIIKQ